MLIHVEQEMLTYTPRYEISVNGHRYLDGKRTGTLLTSDAVELFAASTGAPVCTATARTIFTRNRFLVERTGTQDLRFERHGRWKGHYTCVGGDRSYEIVAHRGRKVSVFCNGEQIAWWTKDAISYREGDLFTVRAHDTADIALLACFVILLDKPSRFSGADDGPLMFSVDIGRIGSQVRKFDRDWKPIESPDGPGGRFPTKARRAQRAAQNRTSRSRRRR